MSTLNAWDIVDANNDDAPPDGWPESTMNYSDVNDAGRAVQGTLKRYFADVNGSLVAGGIADAYTLTLNETGYVAYFAGMYFACKINAANTGASTMNVNGIGVRNIVDRAGNALEGGEITSGIIYEFRDDGTELQLMSTPDLSASSGSSNVGYLPAGAGAVATTSQAKHRERVSVFDFMTATEVADTQLTTPLLDHTAAIQAAIDFVQSPLSNKGTISALAGKYLYTTITISSSDTVIEGVGPATQFLSTSATANGVVIQGATSRIFRCGIRNCLVGQASVNATAGAALFMDNIGHSFIENVWCFQFPKVPFIGVHLNNVSQTSIDNLQINDCGDAGYKQVGCTDIYNTNSRSDNNGAQGWVIDSSGGVYWTNITAFGNTSNALRLTNTVTFAFMTNCIGDTSDSDNWDIDTLRNSVLTNCWGSTHGAGAASDATGFTVANSREVSFIGGQALTCNGHGLDILSSCSRIIISAGDYNDNGRVQASSAGIKVAAPFVSITGPIAGGRFFSSQAFGIELIASATNVSVVAPILTNNATENFKTTANQAGLKVSDVQSDDSITVASASTMTIPNTGDFFIISGTTQINGVLNAWTGRKVTLLFQGILTVADAGNIDIAGNFVTSANDTLTLIFESALNKWVEISRSVN